jgi:hypothetical protein
MRMAILLFMAILSGITVADAQPHQKNARNLNCGMATKSVDGL